MKRLLIFTAIFVLASCSAEYHIEKAKKKGAEFDTEIRYKYITDTDTIVDTLTNTIRIVQVVRDSFPYPVKSIRYVPMSRIERKHLKDSFNHVESIYRLENKRLADSLKNAYKQNKIENRTERKKNNRPIRTMWLIMVCIALGLVALILIKFRPL